MVPPRPPLGQQVHLALARNGRGAALALASDAGQPDLFERVNAVAVETPTPSFLHSALCAMSLPVRRPADEHAPIIRQDGQYTLVINPKPVVDTSGGRQSLRSLGVPFGSLPRLVLIHIMTEAVRTKSRHIRLGETFTDWMRRMGFRTISYGPRGSATLIREQLDRLLACEWMIRWDHATDQGNHEFGIKEIKLTNEYAGVDRGNRTFLREILMTEPFFDHLRQHAVPLNEAAIRQIRDSATALDLYTWLAYRLPRLNPKRSTTLSTASSYHAWFVLLTTMSRRLTATRGAAGPRRARSSARVSSSGPSSKASAWRPNGNSSSSTRAGSCSASSARRRAARAAR